MYSQETMVHHVVVVVVVVVVFGGGGCRCRWWWWWVVSVVVVVGVGAGGPHVGFSVGLSQFIHQYNQLLTGSDQMPPL